LVAINDRYNEELPTFYEFPDGVNIPIGVERYKCTELFFSPEKFIPLRSEGGIHTLIHNAIQECDSSIHSQLYHNIITTGGNALYSGFEERLSLELNKKTKLLASKPSHSELVSEKNYLSKLPLELFSHIMDYCINSQIKLCPITREEKLFASWKGGCKMASHDKFFDQCLFSSEYEEEGPYLVNRHFL